METMEKVEKRLTKFRATLKSPRKLSLPVFISQFHQQWVATEDRKLMEASDSSRNRAEEGGTSEHDKNAFERKGVGSLKVEEVTRRGKRLERNLSYSHSVYGSCTSIPSSNSTEGKELRRGLSISFSSSGAPRRPSSTRHYSTLPNDVPYTPLATTPGASALPGFSSSSSSSRLSLYRSKKTSPDGGDTNSSNPFPKPPHHNRYSHPTLVTTVSSPGGTTSTALVLHPKDLDSRLCEGKSFPLLK